MPKYTTITLITLSALVLSACANNKNPDIVIETNQTEIANIAETVGTSATISTTPEPTTTPEPNKITETLDQYSFTICNSTETFATEIWYNKFTTLISTMPRYTSADKALALSDITRNKLLKPTDIDTICYSPTGSRILALVPADDQGGFQMIKYDTTNNIANISTRSDDEQIAKWSVPPTEFGKRRGANLSLTGNKQADSCQLTNKFSYNYITNKISLNQSCQKCQGEATTTCQTK